MSIYFFNLKAVCFSYRLFLYLISVPKSSLSNRTFHYCDKNQNFQTVLKRCSLNRFYVNEFKKRLLVFAGSALPADGYVCNKAIFVLFLAPKMTGMKGIIND